VTTAFGNGDYEIAGQAAIAVLTQRTFDVRVLPAFFVGAFLETGIHGLAKTLQAIAPLLGDNLAKLGPVDGRAEIADTSFATLFRRLLLLLKYHDGQRDSTWTEWVLHSGDDEVTDIVNACALVRAAAAKAFPKGKCRGEIAELSTWFDETFRYIVERHSTLPELNPDPPPPPSKTLAAAKIVPARKPTRPPPAPPPIVAPPPAPAPPREPATLTPSADTLEIKASPALKHLMQKLQAFELLVERGEVQKAAVVAHDVDKLLADFDPKVYLPGLLSSYFAAFAAHVDELGPYLDATEGRAWQALDQFYQVDLDAFLKDREP
jgi:hypothetical protein